MPTIDPLSIFIFGAVCGGITYLALQKYAKYEYNKEYRRQILKIKTENPDLIQFIDAETTKRGEGVIE